MIARYMRGFSGPHQPPISILNSFGGQARVQAFESFSQTGLKNYVAVAGIAALGAGFSHCNFRPMQYGVPESFKPL